MPGFRVGRLWQITPRYKCGPKSRDVDWRALDPGTAEIFHFGGAPIVPYKHQEQSIALAVQGESYVGLDRPLQVRALTGGRRAGLPWQRQRVFANGGGLG